ncbi:retrovirus-related pol polyprotein from transposon RE1, partial [Tanacetum coccineum]
MLFNANAPATLWVDAFTSAVYIINRLPTKVLNDKSPFELLFNCTPNYNVFRAFGCRVFPYLRNYSAHKLAPRNVACVLSGIVLSIKLSDPSSAQTSSFPPLSLCPETVSSPSVAPTAEPAPSTTAPTPPPQAHTPPLATSETPTPPPVVPATNTHPMTTRSRARNFKTKHIADLAKLNKSALHVAPLSHKEPKGYKSAAKNSKWVATMNNEMSALWSNNTWDLVPRPATSNVVGSKWVLRIKYLSDGSIDRYKARLVAQGFTQVPGLDYSHTFSPV